MTADHVRALLRDRYCKKFGQGGEYALLFEVQSGVGGNRYADAIAMSLFPSRGLAIHGHEIKVSRSDWTRELKNAHKADQLVSWCDYWWIVAPQGIVLPDELPETWGLMEVTKNEKGLRAVTKAPKLERDQEIVDRRFVAALLRRAVEQVEAGQREVRDQAYREAVASAEQVVAGRLATAEAEYERLRAGIEAFTRSSGLNPLQGPWLPGHGVVGPEELGSAVRLLLEGEHQAETIERRLRQLRENCDSIAESIDRILPTTVHA